MGHHTVIREQLQVEMMKKSVAVPQEEVLEVIQEFLRCGCCRGLAKYPQVAQVEAIGHVEYQETVKSLPNLVYRGDEEFVEEPPDTLAGDHRRDAAGQNVEPIRQLPIPQAREAPTQVAMPIVQVRE